MIDRMDRGGASAVMQREARDYVPDPRHPFGGHTRIPTLTIITPKPLTATAHEATQNPRSRSAKLRIAERPNDG